jgi:tryptophanyl-tRNA synthetase
LFTYPILMAADILIFRSNVVPVGKDQVQHIEMTADIASKFNHGFGKKIFPIPEYRLDKGAKVLGTDGQKMSKSGGNSIDIFAEGRPLEKTVMSIKTDSTPAGQPLNPDTCNVFALYSLFATDDEKATLASDYRSGKIGGYGNAKKMLLEKINTYFGPFREKRKELAQRLDDVEAILCEGARKARAVAQETMSLVYKATGLR